MALYDGIAGSGTTMTAKVRYAPWWIGPFYGRNWGAGASNADFVLGMSSGGSAIMTECLYPNITGEVVSLQWSLSAAITQGSFTINIMVAGSSVFTTAAQTSQRTTIAVADGSAVTAAKDRAGLQLNTTANLLPASSIDSSTFLLWVPT